MTRMFRLILWCFTFIALTIPAFSNPAEDPDPASPAAAKAIIKSILDVVGVKTSFEVRAARIPNAAAAVANGKKYILYNPAFMTALSKATGSNRWVPVAVLAHEIGHHLSGHTLTHTSSTPANELEADQFSGFVLRKMGAGLEDAQLAIRTLSGRRATATHPARSDRMDAIALGWRKADDQLAGTGRRVEDTRTRIPVTEERKVAELPALAEQHIAYDVHFKVDPESRYYVTVRNNLVKLSDNQLAILGKLHTTDNEDYPLALRAGNMLMLVSKYGQIVSAEGRQLGQVKRHER